jgi:predicted ATP-dependent protease
MGSLEPQPIPLQIKIILLGDRLLYYLLCELDPDFKDLFKVAAEFEDDIARSRENERLYARLIANLIDAHGLLPFHREAVARLIEHGARLAGDAQQVCLHLGRITDLLTEADYWARHDDEELAHARHVNTAIDNKIYRTERVRSRIQEAILRGTLFIETEGSQTGQVNGLSALRVGDFSFGQPSRITATAMLGKGEVIDIAREVELGGAIHSEGVLILSAFLGARYAGDHPLSLSASLVFEQSYGLVEGDSASVAELCALLSALAVTPIKQSLAVTGSVNQHGQVQAIRGVNEKIEGFFDVCLARGLTGTQGVVIPASNVLHLMLREEVVAAVAEGRFHIWAVDEVDQALELLTDLPAGVPDEHGEFPPQSVNGRVKRRLLVLVASQRRFGTPVAGMEDERGD